MTAPQIHLYIVRHGETEGNINRTLYATKADHAIRLTERGIAQAGAAGTFLAEHLAARRDQETENFGRIRVWNSPYHRARETARHILYPLGQVFDPGKKEVDYRDDPFLFEQQAGLFDGMTDEQYMAAFPNEATNYVKHVQYNGRAYARTPLGESRIDIVIRVKHFFGTIIGDAIKHDIRNVVVVNHGVTVRAITMGWMRYPPEWMDAEKNPGNCWVRHIHGSPEIGYRDEGYIHGHKAPIGEGPMATQRELAHAEDIYMLKPTRPNALVPIGVKVIDPFSKPGEGPNS